LVTSSFPQRFVFNIVHDQAKTIAFCQPPTADEKVNAPAVANVPIEELDNGTYRHLSSRIEWPESSPLPVISAHAIQLFLGFVHAFTTLGLEAQATAFSCYKAGVIKYIGLFPQKNKRNTVYDVSDSVCEYDAIVRFQAQVPGTSIDDFVQRCWIHTHSAHRVCMSHIDVYQMYLCERSGPAYSFSIVSSSKVEKAKLLAVRLTEGGRKAI